MEQTKELNFMLHFAKEAFLDEQIYADQLRSLWTAYCLHHGLDADTKAYDDDLMEVWKAVSEEEADTANWSDFCSFGTFMCAELV